MMIAAVATMYVLAAPGPGAPTAVALTIDDLPFAGEVGAGDTPKKAIRRITDTLAAQSIPATAFVTCKGVKDAAEVLLWQTAGVVLANHSTQHRSVDDLGRQAFIEDAAACKVRLEALTRRPITFFRYPYLQTGKTPELRDATRKDLERLGHRIAPVSIDVSDWALNDFYVVAVRRGDKATAATVASAYVEHVASAALRYRRLASGRYGRDVSQVLVLHANLLMADHLASVLERLQQAGFNFTSLGAALDDAVYSRADAYAGRIGMSWLYRTDPPIPDAWAFDNGQERAFAMRFGGKLPNEPLAIDDDLRLHVLAPGVLVVVHLKPWPANTLVVELSDGTLAIAGSPYTSDATERLLTWLRARFGARRLLAITGHFHPDGGTAGNAVLLAAGAAVYTGDRTRRLLNVRGDGVRAEMLEALKPDADTREVLLATPWVAGDRSFVTEQGVTLADGEVRVVFPGAAHTTDNVAVYFPRRRVLFGGCMVRATKTLGNLADADVASWPTAIRRLEALPADIVVPGHGEAFGKGLLEETARLFAP